MNNLLFPCVVSKSIQSMDWSKGKYLQETTNFPVKDGCFLQVFAYKPTD
jgi:hypothetical protein